MTKKEKESKRLTESPCCLVNPEGTGSANIQKLMKSVNKDYQIGAKILEINPKSQLIKNLASIFVCILSQDLLSLNI